ncbi:MAG: hypothetical protein M0R68_13480, partial [Bacteroidetes bacterium]|nr:hypothetical protein [Bacteroidota bacterium]
MCPFCYIGKR